MLLVEQNANLAIKIAHRVYLLETGRIVASGTADEISRTTASARPTWGTEMERFLAILLRRAVERRDLHPARPRPRRDLPGHGAPQLRPGRDGACSARSSCGSCSDWGVPLWISRRCSGMVSGSCSVRITEVVADPAGRRNARPVAVFVVTIALVPRAQLARRPCIWGAPPSRSVPEPVPERAGRLRDDLRRGWRVRVDRHPRRRARALRPAVPAVREDQVRPRDAGRGEQPATRHASSASARAPCSMASWGLAAAIGAHRRHRSWPAATATVNRRLMFTRVHLRARRRRRSAGSTAPVGAVIARAGHRRRREHGGRLLAGLDRSGDEAVGVALLMIFVVLLVKPTGLFGTTRMERV